MLNEVKLPLQAMVAFLLTAVALSNTNALPLADPCDAVQWKATQRAVTAWVAGLMLDDWNPLSAAETIVRLCDTDDDSTVSRAEFVSCLQRDLQTPGLSTGCYTQLLGAVAAEKDGPLDRERLTRLVSHVILESSQGIRIVEDSRDELVRDQSDSNSESEEDLKRDQSYSNSESGEDLELGEFDSNSESREDFIQDKTETNLESGEGLVRDQSDSNSELGGDLL